MSEEEIGKIGWKTRVALALAILLGLVGVVMCALGLTGVLDVALTNTVTPPLIGTSLLLSGLFTHDRRRAVTVACFAMAAVCYVAFVVLLIV